MVAVIKTGYSILRILNYNENKVKEGVAECIGEKNYPVDVDRLSFSMKHNRLQKQLELNRNVSRGSVHISLNFDPTEQGMDKDKLLQIAGAYMQKIGFGDQPYLVYQHNDAGHPHIHIVSIKVRDDGSRIDMQNIGKNQSETARREIEKEYGLVVADGRMEYQKYRLEPVAMGKVNYGKLQSKKAIANILNGVLESYRYASLPELNAVLRQYNVLADQGSERSRVFRGGGLVYRILDGQGKPVGVPIKASDFYNKPTLKFLEARYATNDIARQRFKTRVKNEIDKAFIGRKPTLAALTKQLEKTGIHVALRKSETGLIYGITYVDHQTKCVFKGSALGKQYSAKAIQERCSGETAISGKTALPGVQQAAPEVLPFREAKQITEKAAEEVPATTPATAGDGILETLMQPEQVADYIPGQLKKKSKKKKRKNNIPGNNKI